MLRNPVRFTFKKRKIIVIDSLCSSSGYCVLVDDAKDMFDEGVDYKEIIKWLEENKNRIHHNSILRI